MKNDLHWIAKDRGRGRQRPSPLSLRTRCDVTRPGGCWIRSIAPDGSTGYRPVIRGAIVHTYTSMTTATIIGRRRRRL
jgi:hypothetical protein